jgi:hypothetical protein
VAVGAAVGSVGRGRTGSFEIIGAAFAVVGAMLGNLIWIAYAVSRVADTSLSATLLGLITQPDILIKLMISSFDLRDLTFHALAAFFGYVLAVSPVRRRRKLDPFP